MKLFFIRTNLHYNSTQLVCTKDVRDLLHSTNQSFLFLLTFTIWSQHRISMRHHSNGKVPEESKGKFIVYYNTLILLLDYFFSTYQLLFFHLFSFFIEITFYATCDRSTQRRRCRFRWRRLHNGASSTATDGSSTRF